MWLLSTPSYPYCSCPSLAIVTDSVLTLPFGHLRPACQS